MATTRILKILNVIAFAGAALLSWEVFGQTYTLATPINGATVQTILPITNGNVVVTFLETIPELSACPGTSWALHGSFPQMVYIDGTNTNVTGNKNVLSILTMASLTGQKITSFTFTTTASGCSLFGVRLH